MSIAREMRPTEYRIDILGMITAPEYLNTHAIEYRRCGLCEAWLPSNKFKSKSTGNCKACSKPPKINKLSDAKLYKGLSGAVKELVVDDIKNSRELLLEQGIELSRSSYVYTDDNRTFTVEIRGRSWGFRDSVIKAGFKIIEEFGGYYSGRMYVLKKVA